MKPGRELDALVAEKVMGLVEGKDFGEWPEHDWKRDEDGEVDIFATESDTHNGPACIRCHYGYCHHCQSGPTQPCKVEPRRYSASISSAWEVVEAMRAKGWNFQIDDLGYRMDAGGNEVLPGGEWRVRFDINDQDKWADAEADTPSHGICLAALQVFGVSEGSPPTP